MKADDNVGLIVKFKFETLNKIKSDSLDARSKLDLLVDETTKFNDRLTEESPSFSNGLRYLIVVVGLLIAIEVAFFIAERRRTY